MKRRKVLAMLMTAVMTFSSVAPETALMVHAEDGIVIEEVSEEDAAEEAASENEAVSADEAEENAAEEEAVSADEAAEASEENEAVSEKAAEETEVKELPYGLKGMPAGYVMSEKEKALKEDAAAHDLAADVINAVEGADYAADTVFFLAEDEEYAKTVADAYNAGLKSYDGYVATLDLTGSGLTVAEAVAVGSDPAYDLPLVEADYFYTVGTGYEGSGEQLDEVYYWGFKSEESGWGDIVGLMYDRDPLLNPNDKNYQWWHEMIGSYSAWGVMGYDFSSSGIKVAVIDTGVNASHEEFSGHLVADVTDAHGHGSNVAGIIGASADNGYGGAGVAPGIQMLGYNCNDAAGNLDMSKVLSAVDKATESGADIINMSLGGPQYSPGFMTTVDQAYKAGVTVIAAAGNEGSNTVAYPACYDHVISVAAVKQDGTLTHFTNNGDTIVDIAAPGADMLSCNMGASDSYVKMQGTSQASPVVAGVCAVYMSINGKVSPDEMLKALKDGATKTSAKGDGAGIVNLGNMLKADTTGPKITLVDASGKEVVVEGGKSGSATVLADAQIKLASGNYNGNVNGNANTHIFFTINGKTPSFDKQGWTNPGTYECPDGQLDLQEWPFYAGSFGDKYTIKAITANAMGIVSKVTTLKLTVGVGTDSGLYINGPEKLAAGLSGNMRASIAKKSGGIEGLKMISSGVKWEITDGKEYATINSKTGKLTVNKNVEAGKSVTVKASYNGLTQSYTIPVGGVPVKSIALSETKLAMSFYKDSAVLNTVYEKEISITEVKDAQGNVITDRSGDYYYWSSSNYDVVYVTTVDDVGKKVKLIACGKGTARITVYANDGSTAKAVINVTVVNLVDWIMIKGQENIAQGEKAAYKATVEPTNAKMKTVKWSVYTDYDRTTLPDGVSVDEKKGIVSVAKTVPAGSGFYLFAEAADGGKAYADIYITVTPARTKKITVTTTATDPAYKISTKNGSIASLQLFTQNVPSSAVDESAIELTAQADSGCFIEWTSSNRDVVDVWTSGEYVYLNAYSKGNVTITGKASDGSNAKVSFRVSVIVPVSGIELTNDTLATYADPTGESMTFSMLASGSSTRTKAIAGDAYGKPSNAKISWKMEPCLVIFNGDALVPSAMSAEDQKMVLEKKWVSGANGTVQFHKDLYKLHANNVGVLLTASTTDGTGISAQKLFVASSRINQMYAARYNELMNPEIGNKAFKTNLTFTIDHQENFTAYTADAIAVAQIQDDNKDYMYLAGDMNVVSSNPEIATGYYNREYGIILVSCGSKTGKCTFTCTLKDGSNKKIRLTVIVK